MLSVYTKFISGIIFFLSSVAIAADDPGDVRQRRGDGDPAAGKDKIAICKVCHGEGGNSTHNYYPKLAGQYGEYLLRQLKDFKSGQRRDPMMSAMVQSAGSDDDLEDIAAYYSSQDQMKGDKPVLNKAGEALFKAEVNGCNSCHGEKGKGLAPDNAYAPVIGGQNKDYLVRQLKNFRNGNRYNDTAGMMRMVAENMTDEDIENVAAYISGL